MQRRAGALILLRTQLKKKKKAERTGRSLQKETSRDQRVGEVRMVELQGWQRFLSSYVLTALRVSAKALPHDGPSPTIPWKKMLCCSWRDTEHSEPFIRLTANRKNLRERELQVAAGTSSIPQLNSYTQIQKNTILFWAVAWLGRKVQEMWNEKVAAEFPSAQTLKGLYYRTWERNSVSSCGGNWMDSSVQTVGSGSRSL